MFHAMNTNKRSVTLDLQSENGRALFKELVRQADVVIENFSPRVMDQFGLGADTLLELNPRVVVVRMPAFGLTGPVAGQGRLRADDGADRRAGLGDRPARRSPGGTARGMRPARGRTCGFRDPCGTGIRGSNWARPARRGPDDRNGVERHRGPDNRIRGLRGGHGAPGQPWTHRRGAGRLPMCGGGLLGRPQRPQRCRTPGAGRAHRRLRRRRRGMAGRAGRGSRCGRSCRSRDSGGRRDLTIVCDRQSATDPPRILRAARASAYRYRSVSVPPVHTA